jgi:hypothetical protein
MLNTLTVSDYYGLSYGLNFKKFTKIVEREKF